MGDTNIDGAGVGLAVRLAREARALLEELRTVVRRESAADAIRALRALFDLPEEQVERLSQDIAAQRVGALPYVKALLARRCDELIGQDSSGQPAEGGHA